MKRELTPWFPGDVKPVRAGVYERNDSGTFMHDSSRNFSYWDGRKWLVSANSPQAASAVVYARSALQGLPWRGLASDPAKKK